MKLSSGKNVGRPEGRKGTHGWGHKEDSTGYQPTNSCLCPWQCLCLLWQEDLLGSKDTCDREGLDRTLETSRYLNLSYDNLSLYSYSFSWQQCTGRE